MVGHPLLEYLELERPLAFIDAASTGLDTRTARIVRLTVLKIDPGGNERTRTVLVNPGTPIPPGATEVHGITDDDVSDVPNFRAYAKGLAEHLEGCDLAGFGVERFDAPLLVEEFRRSGVEFNLQGRVVLDAMAIFHRLEPRDLRAAYKKFADGELQPVTEGETAARAAAEILLGELATSAGLPRSPRQLAAWAKGVDDRALDSEGKFIWSANNEALINFGKHRGRRLSEVAAGEPDYLEWIAGNPQFDTDTREIAKNAVDGSMPVPPGS